MIKFQINVVIDKTTPIEFDFRGNATKPTSAFDEYQTLSILAKDKIRFLPVEIKSIIGAYCKVWKHKKISGSVTDIIERSVAGQIVPVLCVGGRIHIDEISSDGRLVAVSMPHTAQGFIIILDIKTDTCIRIIKDKAACIKFSGDGTKMVYLNFAGQIKSLNIETGESMDAVYDVDHLYSTLFVNSTGNEIKVISFAPGATHARVISKVGNDFSNTVQFDYQRRMLWKMTKYSKLPMCMSRCGCMLVAFTYTSYELGGFVTIVSWEDWSTDKVGNIEWSKTQSEFPEKNVIAVSPSKKMIATGSEVGTLIFARISVDSKLETRRFHHKPITALAFSSDDKILASSSSGFINLYDIDADIVTRFFEIGESWAESIVFSGNSRMLMSSLSDMTVSVWNLNENKDYVN